MKGEELIFTKMVVYGKFQVKKGIEVMGVYVLNVGLKKSIS